MEKIFKLKENGTTARTEIVAGLTTFMTMAYIIALNPNLLTNFATGTPLWNAVFMATCIASAIGMLVMAFAANKPFAMAPGMGLNSFFAVVVANIATFTGLSYEEAFPAAMCIILVEGVFFVILTLFSIREKIVEAIPFGIRIGITPAIGLMLLNVGFGSNAGLYSEKGGPFYVLSTFFGSLTPSVARDTVGSAYPQLVLYVVTMLIGVFAIVVLSHHKVKASVILGMLISCIVYWGGSFIFLDTNPFASLATASFVPPLGDMLDTTFFKFDFKTFISIGWFTAVALIITFCMIDMFDTIGTLVGTAARANMLDKDGKMPKMKEALLADAVGTVAGACTGTSTVTTFIESGSGNERRTYLCRHSYAQRPQERRLGRYPSGHPRCAYAHLHANHRLDRPRHRHGADLLLRRCRVHRQGKGGLDPDLCAFGTVPRKVLHHSLIPIQLTGVPKGRR